MTDGKQELHYPGFRRWLGMQSGRYDVTDPERCPMAEYARERFAFKRPFASLTKVRDMDTGRRLQIVDPYEMGLWGRLADLAGKGGSYEALCRSLDERFTKTGLRRRTGVGSHPGRPIEYPTKLTGSFKRGAVG